LFSSFLHRFQMRELLTGIPICIYISYVLDFISDPKLVWLQSKKLSSFLQCELWIQWIEHEERWNYIPDEFVPN
jgi:hypothetical protein